MFMCKKDLIMEDGTKAFTKNIIYKGKYKNKFFILTNNENRDHSLSVDYMKKYFNGAINTILKQL